MSDNKKPTTEARELTITGPPPSTPPPPPKPNPSKDGEKKKGVETLRWIHAANGDILPHAVVGGEDLKGNPAYVGRAMCKGQLLPGSVVPKTGHCYVPFGTENSCKVYEVLTNPEKVQLKWVPTKQGEFPAGAVPVGSQNGETLYIGRRKIEGHLLLGKVHVRQYLWVPLRGKETPYPEYELLVCGQ